MREKKTPPIKFLLSRLGRFFTGKVKNPRNLGMDQRGWTLVELMLVTALIGIITPAITLLFSKVSQGMAADEMHGQMKTLNEMTTLRIHERLLANKHMFQNNALGTGFLSRIQLSGTPVTLLGSRLAQSQPSSITSFSPLLGGSIPASFGNCLFFAAFDASQTFLGASGPVTSTAPLTIFSAVGSPVTYGTGGPATMVLDVYRFFYYYLTPINSKSLRGIPSYRLVEWQSVPYIDWHEIFDMYNADNILGQRVINWVTKSGPANFPGGPIATAYDPSQTDPTLAFVPLTSGSYTNTPIANPTINQASWSYLTRISSGILSSGFNYGVSANSVTWKSAPAAVPQFTTASGSFPGGFEVGMIGNAGGLEILTRTLLVAQGGSPRIVWNDQTMTHNARDIW